MSKKVAETNARALPIRDRSVVQLELSPRSIAYAVVGAALVWLTIQLFPIILVLVVALFLVGTLNPIVEWLEAHRVRRGLAIAIVLRSLPRR
jgi:predicted PurR-regulated permease PerM